MTPLLSEEGVLKNRDETKSLEKGTKATITLEPTDRKFGWKAIDEHCSREFKCNVYTFPEHFQESACERTESAHVILPCTAQLGHLDNVMVVSKTQLPHVTSQISQSHSRLSTSKERNKL